MKNKRRAFLKLTGLTGLTVAGGGIFKGLASAPGTYNGLGLDQLSLLAPPRQSFQMNEQIKAAYEVALNILKPTKKQLEHGLKLHRDSLVIDTYGFMPRASVDGAVIMAAINDNASPLEIQDMQEDMSMSRFVINERERAEFKNAWKAAGVTCVIQNAGEEGNEVKRLLKRLAHFTYTTDMMRDFIGKAVTPIECW